MATIRLVPSIMDNDAGTSYLTIENESNAFTNTDSDTYAIIRNIYASTSNRYFRLRGFNFDDIPNGAVINSFTIKVKGISYNANTSTTFAAPKLMNGSDTTLGGTCPPISARQVYEFTNVTTPFSTLLAIGDNFGIRFNCRRTKSSTAASIYIYGAEILVDYTAQGGSDTLYVKDNNAWEETVPYKKVNGTWELQVDVTNVFDSTKKYIKGN